MKVKHEVPSPVLGSDSEMLEPFIRVYGVTVKQHPPVFCLGTGVRRTGKIKIPSRTVLNALEHFQRKSLPSGSAGSPQVRGPPFDRQCQKVEF